MITSEKYYQIALLEVEGIGPATARQLIHYFGSAKEVLQQNKNTYKELGKIGKNILLAKEDGNIFTLAEKEINYCKNKGISIISYTDNEFPSKLNYCDDAPIILYFKGRIDFKNRNIISIVGTRNNTKYGERTCRELIEAISPHNPIIISGLAYGIDIIAHSTALTNKLETVAVLAHGLDRIYPKAHSNIAKKAISNGGLLTEFKTNTNPDRENFPKRNRIVAGMSDATIVIESAIRGGSMITAYLANSYNRDVFAVPGKNYDEFSQGCNHLIKTNKAHLLQSAEDLGYILGWDIKSPPKKHVQQALFKDLTELQKKIITSIPYQSKMNVDEIALKTQLPMSVVSTELLLMEFNGIIRQLPGKMYELV